MPDRWAAAVHALEMRSAGPTFTFPSLLFLCVLWLLPIGCEGDGEGESCPGGVCACEAPLAACATGCAELSSNANNCGACGNVCDAAELCSVGACTPASEGCPEGLTACDGGCVDMNASAFHCGACGLACGAGQACETGKCVGGTLGTGGTTSGGTGGSSSGGSASGGSSSGGSSSGGSSSGGSSSGGSSSGGSPGTSDIFDQCRFHFGTFRDYAIDNAGIRSEIDFFIPGWMGLSDTFDQQYVCDDVKGTLAGKVPVVVAYVSAFYAKREQDLNDCNVGQPDLCTYGAEIIQENLDTIIGIYESYAQGYADCLPEGYPIIFEMEPDWFQYTIDEQNDPLTPAEAGTIMGQFVQAIRNVLPNAHFSMDISPWVPPNNGSDHGADWFSNFNLAPFSFINTSGGGTEADNDQIRSTNNMTWAGVGGVTEKLIIADTGYGVDGANEGHDDAWDDPDNINARIADGVVGVAQYNPKSDWGTTLSNIRSQLDTPAGCP